jgi:hypothetical protein
MDRGSRIAALVLFIFCAASAHADVAIERQGVEIPLGQIWAYSMPTTKDVRELDATAQKGIIRHPQIEEIRRALAARNRPKAGDSAGQGFVVFGEGKDALKNAAAVFAGKSKPLSVVPSGEKSSLVFFSYSCGRYVHLLDARRSAGKVVLEYQFVSHSTAEMTSHFALIPLGELSEGDYRVKIVQSKPATTRGLQVTMPIPNPEEIVCNSFSFRVTE